MTAPTLAPAFLRPDEAAAFMSVSVRCLSELARRGIVRPARISHKLTLYAVADLTEAVLRYRSPSARRTRNTGEARK